MGNETRNQLKRSKNHYYKLEEKAQCQTTTALHYVIGRPLRYTNVEEIEEEVKLRNSEAELVYSWARSLALKGILISSSEFRERMSKTMFENPVEELAALGLGAPNYFDLANLRNGLINSKRNP